MYSTSKNRVLAQYLAARFFSNAAAISATFEGDLKAIGFAATVNNVKAGSLANVQLRVLPESPELIEASCNYHYPGQSPPNSAQEITQRITEQYDGFLQALCRL